MRSYLIILIITCFFTNQIKAQTEGFKNNIDTLLSQWDKSNAPGIAVGVVQKGKLMYRQSYGMANINKGIPIDSSTQFWIASVSKQFTAAAIYLLESENKINLGHSARHYLKSLPPLFESITINHLLHHTSGIRDGFVLTALSKKTEESYTNQNVLKYLQQQKSLNFKSGTEFEYNNSGYVLLAMIIEQVSGISYPEFLKQNIFSPLGMYHTYVSGKYISTNTLAEGYHIKDNSNSNATYEEGHFKGNTYGSTGVITNIADLIRWAEVFQNPNKFLKFKGIVLSMLKTGKLSNGKGIAYGGGLEKFVYKGRTVYEHFGADEGFKANIVYFPSSQLTIIGLTNNSTNYQLSKTIYSIADVLQKGKPDNSEPAEQVGEPLLTAYYYSKDKMPVFRKLKKFNGYAKISDTPDGYEAIFKQTNDILHDFNVPNAKTYKFLNRDNLSFIDAYYHQSRNLELFTPVTRTTDLNNFTGVYSSPELQTSYEIITKDNSLFLEFAPQIQFKLFRLTDNDFIFDYNGGNFIQFTKEGFEFSREGCRRLIFKKQ